MKKLLEFYKLERKEKQVIMYYIKQETKRELKSNTQLYCANILGVTEQLLSAIMRGKLPCKRYVAIGLISIRFQIPINDAKMEEYLKKYFTKAQKERRNNGWSNGGIAKRKDEER